MCAVVGLTYIFCRLRSKWIVVAMLHVKATLKNLMKKKKTKNVFSNISSWTFSYVVARFQSYHVVQQIFLGQMSKHNTKIFFFAFVFLSSAIFFIILFSMCSFEFFCFYLSLLRFILYYTYSQFLVYNLFILLLFFFVHSLRLRSLVGLDSVVIFLFRAFVVHYLN